ncbi:MAG TPA: metallophosphoesterase [Actinomycetota bacterium]|nr:metallophosphoesterase [Actinomycetota bacterium]
MTAEKLAEEMVDDLIRSCWIVETARSKLYERWGGDPYERFVAGCTERADLLAAALAAKGRKPDAGYVEAHLAWMLGLVGESPTEVPFGNLLIARLGDWVDRHVPGFLEDGAALVEIGDRERSALVFPEEFPPPPPFEPVETVDVEPPGDVKFRFAILADLHFGSPRGEAHARAAIDDINRSGADLVIQLGDLADHGNAEEFELGASTLSELTVPLTTMMGNHDVFSHATGDVGGRDLYSSSFGRDPDGILIRHEGVNLLVLDSAEHAASPFPAFDFASGSFLDGPGGAVVRGAFSPPQHDLLAQVAAPDAGPGFVFLHHPPQPFTAFPPVVFGLNDRDSGRLHATVDSGNVWGVFAGHTHRSAITRMYAKVPAVEVAMPRDYPFGYALVDVTDEGYAYRFVQLSDEALLRGAYASAGALWRRYALGPRQARGFAWTPATGPVTP